MRGNNKDKSKDFNNLELIHHIPFQKHKTADERETWPIVSLSEVQSGMNLG